MKILLKSSLYFKVVFCSFSFADGKHSVSEYLQAFAGYLKNEYMHKSIEKIFGWADKLVMVS